MRDTCHSIIFLFLFLNDRSTFEIYTLSYTTLFRSRRILECRQYSGFKAVRDELRKQHRAFWTVLPRRHDAVFAIHRGLRSEEHTSELQSQFHLVCRLLLEKKKNKIKL